MGQITILKINVSKYQELLSLVLLIGDFLIFRYGLSTFFLSN
jgi:hypothetical protein